MGFRIAQSEKCWTCDEKVANYDSQQWWWENFLLQSYLSVLTLIQCELHPLVTTVAHRRPWSFCQKCKWLVTPKYACTLDPIKSEWADYAVQVHNVGTYLGNELTCNSSENTQPVFSACWATVDWSWTKGSPLKEKKERKKKHGPGMNHWTFPPTKSSHARTKPPPPSLKQSTNELTSDTSAHIAKRQHLLLKQLLTRTFVE